MFNRFEHCAGLALVTLALVALVLSYVSLFVSASLCQEVGDCTVLSSRETVILFFGSHLMLLCAVGLCPVRRRT